MWSDGARHVHVGVVEAITVGAADAEAAVGSTEVVACCSEGKSRGRGTRRFYTGTHKGLNAGCSCSNENYGQRNKGIQTMKGFNDELQIAKLLISCGCGDGDTCCRTGGTETYLLGNRLRTRRVVELAMSRFHGMCSTANYLHLGRSPSTPCLLLSKCSCCCPRTLISWHVCWDCKFGVRCNKSECTCRRDSIDINASVHYHQKTRGEYQSFHDLFLLLLFPHYFCLLNGKKSSNIISCGTSVSQLFLTYSETHGASLYMILALAADGCNTETSGHLEKLQREAPFLLCSIFIDYPFTLLYPNYWFDANLWIFLHCITFF